MLSMNPTVSVIVPNFNHAAYLEKRLQSVLAQTFDDFEVIILDDCSTDNSMDIIEQFRSHPKVAHVLLSDKNGGSTFLQWSRGIELARGAYIWIAESDDFCEPTLLETLVRPMLANHLVNLSFCQALYVDPSDDIIGHTFAKKLSDTRDGKKFIASHMLGLNGIPNVSLVVFRKESFYAVSQEYRKMLYCGDWYFWVSIAMHGQVFISGKYLSYFLRHTANVSGKSEKNGLFFLEGNSFFKEFAIQSQASSFEILQAVKIKLRRFLDTRTEMTPTIQKKVLTSLFCLHPSARNIYYRYVLQDRIKSLMPLSLKN
jgi:glycosyltransferase involved in cell wall biosynthesis